MIAGGHSLRRYLVLEPFWLHSFSSSTPLLRPIPNNATCKDPGHHTLICVICNCILHNINDLETKKENRGHLREPRNNSERPVQGLNPKNPGHKNSCGERESRDNSRTKLKAAILRI